MSHLYRVAPNEPSYGGVPIGNMKKLDWGTTRVLLTDSPVGQGAEAKLETGSEVGHKTRTLVKVLCYVVTIYASIVFPLACIFYSLEPRASLNAYVLALASNVVISLVLAGEWILYERQGRSGPADKGPPRPARRSERIKQRLWDAGKLALLLPWGALLAPITSDPFVLGLGCMCSYVHMAIHHHRYFQAIVNVVRWYVPQPPHQIMRLVWLGTVVLVIQNVFGACYYYLGWQAIGEDNWIKNDGLDSRNSTRMQEDPFGVEALRYARSAYFIYQTLLTVGYGNIGPLSGMGRLFGAFMCLVGVFVLAYLIANMTSYLVNMDTTPSAHRASVERVEKIMAAKSISNPDRDTLRAALRRTWNDSKGLPSVHVLEDLPDSLFSKVLEEKIELFARVFLFRRAGGKLDKLFQPACFYALEHLEQRQFERDEEIETADATSPDEAVLCIVLSGTLQKATSSRDGSAALGRLPGKKTFSIVPLRAIGDKILSRVKSRSQMSNVTPTSEAGTTHGTSCASYKSEVQVLGTTKAHANAGIQGPGNGIEDGAATRKTPTAPTDAAAATVAALSAAAAAGAARRESNAKRSDVEEGTAAEDTELEEERGSIIDSAEELLRTSMRAFKRRFSSGKLKITPKPKAYTIEELRYHARCPSVLRPGNCIGSHRFFLVNNMQPAPYKALTDCTVMFMRRSDLYKISALYPEWGMEAVCQRLKEGEQCVDLDGRVARQVSAEKARTDCARQQDAETVYQLRLHNISRLQRQMTMEQKARESKFNVTPHGRLETAWDILMMLVILYNSLLIPVRLAGVGNSDGVTMSSLGFAALDLLGDVLIVLNRFLKPRVLKQPRDRASNSGAAGLVTHMALAGKSNRKVDPMLDTSIIDNMVKAERTAARRRRRKRIIYQLRLATETLLMLLSMASFVALASSTATLEDEELRIVEEALVYVRIPFLVRTLMVVELFELLTAHYQSRSQESGATRAHDMASRFISTQLAIAFALSAHWIACYGTTIVDESGSLPDRYLLGAYWAVTTMTTVGFGDIAPTSGADSLYTSLIAILGVAVYSIMVSLIGTFLKEVELSEHHTRHYRACLGAFMLDRRVSAKLQARVWQYLDYVESEELIDFYRVLGVGELGTRLEPCYKTSREHYRERCATYLLSVAEVGKLPQSSDAEPSDNGGEDRVLSQLFSQLHTERSLRDVSKPAALPGRMERSLSGRKRSRFAEGGARKPGGPGGRGGQGPQAAAPTPALPALANGDDSDCASVALDEEDMLRARIHRRRTSLDLRSRPSVLAKPTMASLIASADEPISLFKANETEALPHRERALLVRRIASKHIRQSRLFQDVSEDFVAELCHHLRLDIFCEGDEVVGPHRDLAEMYFVEHGLLREHDADMVPLGAVHPGSCFNERGLRSAVHNDARWSAPTSVTVAVEETQVWAVTRRAVRQAMELFPSDAEAVRASYAHHSKVDHSADTSTNLRRGGKLAMLGASAGGSMEVFRHNKRKIYDLDSPVQIYWTHFMFVVLLYNYIQYPVRVTFVVQDTATVARYARDYVLDVAFLVDVFLRCRHFEISVGLSKPVRDPSEIRAVYLASVFGVCDVLAALPLDLLAGIVLAAWPTAFPVSYLAILRTNKLFRGVRFIQHISALGRSIKNQNAKSVVVIAKLVFMLLLVAHWAGCLFYFVATTRVGRGGSWADLDHQGLLRIDSVTGELIFADPDATWLQHYTSSLYFAVATVTAVGYGDITPVSTTEILCTIMIILVGCVIYSVIIAYLEDIVAQADLTSVLYQQKSDAMTSYGAACRLPSQMRSRIKQYVLEKWISQKAVEDATIMSYLNPSLRTEVLIELAGESNLRKIPVIGSSNIWRYLLRHMQLVVIPGEDVVFEVGQEAEFLYVLVEGTVNLTSGDSVTIYSTVGAGGTLGQDGFFRLEGYHSSARSTGHCRLLRLDKSHLIRFLSDNLHLREGFLAEHAAFVAKPSLLARTRKNLDNKKLTKMLQRAATEMNGPHNMTGLDRYVLHPTTSGHTAWHMFVFCVTNFNCIIVPYMIGTYSARATTEKQAAYLAFAQGMLVFNVLADLAMWVHVFFCMFLIARVADGVLLQRSRAIKKAYFSSVLGFMDILSVLPVDLIVYAVTVAVSEGDDAERAEGVYLTYIARSVRVYWLFYLSEYWSIADMAIDSSQLSIKSGLRHLAKIVYWVLLTSHWLACMHTALVDRGRDPSSHDLHFVDSIYFIIYTMTTVGYGNESVVSDKERIFSMVVMILGAFLCDAGITSTLVSIIDIEDSTRATSGRLQEAATQLAASLKLSPATTEAVVEYFNHRLEERGWEHKEMLRLYNAHIAEQIKGVLTMRAMGRPPEQCEPFVFFSPGMIRTMIAHLKLEVSMPGDVLVAAGDVVDRFVFVISGTVKVFLQAPKAAVTGRNDDNGGQKMALAALENAQVANRVATLRDPGLLLANREYGSLAKETVTCDSVCETWLCDSMLYQRLVRMQPPIGGLFNSLEEMLSNTQAAKSYSDFLSGEGRAGLLELMLAIEAYKRSSGTDQRVRKASSIVKKFLTEGESTFVQLDAMATERVRTSYAAGESSLFDGLQAELSENLGGELLQRFMKDASFRQMVRTAHERLRQRQQKGPAE